MPGLKLNLNGSGVSLSAGVRGARVNFGSRGTYVSAGVPGTKSLHINRLIAHG